MTSWFDRKNIKLPFVLDVSHSLFTKGITTAFGLAASIIVTRTLGPDMYGVYSLVIIWIGIILQLGLVGMHSSNSYYVALERSKLGVLLGNSTVFMLLVTAIVALFLIAARFVIHIPLGLPEDRFIWIIILGTLLSLANLVLQNLCIAIKKVQVNNYVLITAKTLGFGLLMYFYLTKNLTVNAALIVFLTEIFLTISYLFPYLMKSESGSMTLSRNQFNESIKYGFRAYLVSIFGFLVIRSDVFLVKYFLDFEQVGFYSVAVKFSDQVQILSATIAGILMPRLTMISDINMKKYRTKQVVKVVAIILLFCIAPFLLFGREIILLLFGDEFLPSVLTLRILLVAVSFLSIQTLLAQFLASEGLPVQLIYIWGVAFAVNLGLNLVLIPKIGIEGAAISSLISYALVLITVFFYLRKTYIGKSSA
ncbi:MAG: flippase [Flavobacteriales bacterium]|nr:flippase [Bacteroidota bacterium]MCB9241573.1 flippase [Flavobacteriales bacterium]